jgi:hypothetical protein
MFTVYKSWDHHKRLHGILLFVHFASAKIAVALVCEARKEVLLDFMQYVYTLDIDERTSGWRCAERVVLELA